MGLELLLPVILFIITLIIIYMLRVEDKRDRRLDLMKQKVGQFSRELEASRNQFKDTSQQVEERINHRIDAANQMLLRIDGQLTDLEVRSEDLATLQGVLNTYRDSLTKLGTTTTQVEARIEHTRNEIQRIEAVEATIRHIDERLASFKQMLQATAEESADSISQQQMKVKQLLDTSYATLQDYAAEVQEIERQNQSRVASHAETLKTNEADSLSVLTSQLGKIRQLGDDAEQIIANTRRELEAVREQSFQDVKAQQEQYEVLKSESEEFFKIKKESLFSLVDDTKEKITEALDHFSEQCDQDMQGVFSNTITKTDHAFQTMILTISTYFEELQERVVRAQKMSQKLEQQEHASLQSFSTEIQRLCEQYEHAEEALRKGARKQEELQQIIQHLKTEATVLQAELEVLKKERTGLTTENSEQKKAKELLEASFAAISLQLREKQKDLESAQQALQAKQEELETLEQGLASEPEDEPEPE
ncbi:MAG: SpiroCoCo family coiled-coil protein, partial [Sphaerochaetaceae bacterium]